VKSPRFTVPMLLVAYLMTAAARTTPASAQAIREAQLGPLRVTAPVGYHLGVASDQGMIGVFQDSVPGGAAPDRNRRGFQLGLSMFARIQERCTSAACHPFQRAGLSCLAAPTTALSARADSGLTAVVCRAPGDSVVAFFMGDTTRFSTFFDTFVVQTLRRAH
jgi:hypothetical protein